jgi:hypothetical protein
MNRVGVRLMMIWIIPACDIHQAMLNNSSLWVSLPTEFMFTKTKAASKPSF